MLITELKALTLSVSEMGNIGTNTLARKEYVS